jgi:hypothetical protein
VADYLRELQIQTIRAKLELCRIVAASLMKSIQSQELSADEMRSGYRCWLRITQDGDALEWALDLIRRRERETRNA